MMKNYKDIYLREDDAGYYLSICCICGKVKKLDPEYNIWICSNKTEEELMIGIE